MRSTPSLRSLHNVTFETVPMFVWLTMAHSRPFKEDRLTASALCYVKTNKIKIGRNNSSNNSQASFGLHVPKWCHTRPVRAKRLHTHVTDPDMSEISRLWKHQHNHACTKKCHSSKGCSWILNGRRRRKTKQKTSQSVPPKTHHTSSSRVSTRISYISLERIPKWPILMRPCGSCYVHECAMTEHYNPTLVGTKTNKQHIPKQMQRSSLCQGTLWRRCDHKNKV